jgi:hypothetical protein
MTPDSLIECGFSLFMLLVYFVAGERPQPVQAREWIEQAEEICYRELEKRP